MITMKSNKNSYMICPACNRGKLISENQGTDDIAIRLIKPNGNKKARWLIKCPVCKEQIEIVLIR